MIDLVCLILLIYVPNILSNEYTQVRGEGNEIRTYLTHLIVIYCWKLKEGREKTNNVMLKWKEENSGGFEFVVYVRPRVLTESDIEKRI